MEILKEMLVFTPEFQRTMIVMTVTILVDIVTGLLNAFAKKEIKSSTMREGLTRKFGYIFGVVIAYFIGTMMNAQNAFGIGTAGLIIANEAISVTENLGALGIPLPKFFTKFLETLKEKYDSEDYIGAHETKE